MNWTCPNCGKEFRNSNQEHSCARVPVDFHFDRKPPEIRRMYDKILEAIGRFGPFSLNPVKSSIQVKAGATFLSIHIKTDRLELEFFLDREIKKPPIVWSVRVSGQRVLNRAVLESLKQIDSELKGWLRESYRMVAESK